MRRWARRKASRRCWHWGVLLKARVRVAARTKVKHLRAPHLRAAKESLRAGHGRVGVKCSCDALKFAAPVNDSHADVDGVCLQGIELTRPPEIGAWLLRGRRPADQQGTLDASPTDS